MRHFFFAFIQTMQIVVYAKVRSFTVREIAPYAARCDVSSKGEESFAAGVFSASSHNHSIYICSTDAKRTKTKTAILWCKELRIENPFSCELQMNEERKKNRMANNTQFFFDNLINAMRWMTVRICQYVKKQIILLWPCRCNDLGIFPHPLNRHFKNIIFWTWFFFWNAHCLNCKYRSRNMPV